MRISKTVSFTLPPDMWARVEELAQEENRTMSELIREALRHYESAKRLHQLSAYGRKRAQKTALKEKDVVAAVKEVRKTLWPKYRKEMGWDTPEASS